MLKKKKRKKGTLEHKVAFLFYFNSTAWQTYGPALRFCRMVNAFIQEIKPTFSVYSNPILLPPRILAVGHFSTDWNLNCADKSNKNILGPKRKKGFGGFGWVVFGFFNNGRTCIKVLVCVAWYYYLKLKYFYLASIFPNSEFLTFFPPTIGRSVFKTKRQRIVQRKEKKSQSCFYF